MSTAKKVEDKIAKTIRKEFDDTVDQAFDDLFKNSEQNNRLPEFVFVQDFLPFFSGKVKDSADMGIMTNWIAIAGSAAKPLDIVDEQDRVLFTVPPLMTSNFLHEKQNLRGRSFNEIIRYAQEQGNRFAPLGVRALASEATSKLERMKISESRDDVDAWNKIFQRYGVVSEKTGRTSTDKKSGDDDLVWD